jgi:hypothetical protein
MFKKFLLIALFTLMVSAPLFAQAQAGETKSTAPIQKLQEIQPDSGYEDANEYDLAATLGTIVNAALSLLGIVFIILTIYAGYNWMIARGDEAKVEKAKDTLTRAIIGIIIVVGSYAIWQFVFKAIFDN